MTYFLAHQNLRFSSLLFHVYPKILNKFQNIVLVLLDKELLNQKKKN